MIVKLTKKKPLSHNSKQKKLYAATVLLTFISCTFLKISK